MAAQVDVQPGEVGRAVAGGRLHLSPLTDSSNKSLIEIPSINQSHIIAAEPKKPVPAPKPRLTPKPFVVEKNPTVKPILAPKPQTKPRPESTRLPGQKPELPSCPKPQQPAASGKLKPVSTNPNRPASTSFKTSTGQTTKPIVQPFKPAPPLDPIVPSKPTPPVPAERKRSGVSSYSKSFTNLLEETTQKDNEQGLIEPSRGNTSITRAKSLGFLLDVGQDKEKKEKAQPEGAVSLRPHLRSSRPRPVSAIFPDSPTKTETTVPSPRWSGRRPLSADLTSKFESIGLSLHRSSPKTNTGENTPEDKAQQQTRDEDKTPKTMPQSANALDNSALSDQSDKNNKEIALKDTEDDKRGVIKSRINLLHDSSSSPGASPTGQGSDFPSPAQPPHENEPPVGIKRLIKQLTEDTTPTQSPVLKPVPKPRPLPLDLTKRFSPERSPDLVSLTETAERQEINKDPQWRVEESAFPPSDQTKTFLESKYLQEQLKKASTPEGPEAEQAFGATSKESGPVDAVQKVRASLFDNVVERHNLFMMDDTKTVNAAKDSLGSPSTKRKDVEDEGTLVTATYKESVSPSSPFRVVHAFDTVQAVEENRAVSESVPTALWEDKAMTLRSRRSEGNKTGPAQGQSPSTMTAEPQTRYLRVGALKWNNPDFSQNLGMEKGTSKEPQREGQTASDKEGDQQRAPELDDVAAAPKKMKVQQAEEQSKPKATYFALTGQMQESFSLESPGVSLGDTSLRIDDLPARAALSGSQGKVLPMKRNPSLDEAFGKPSQEEVENLMRRSDLSSRDLIELEKHRLREKKEREEAEKIRQVALEQEMLRMRELNKEKERQRELRSMLDAPSKEARIDPEQKKELQKETERHMAKMKELEREKQRHLELEKQAQLEFARMKELEMQREVERQRQKVFEKQKQEFEQKQRELERQKQIELKKQKQQEFEKEKQREREKEEKRHALERQKQIELEKRRLQELEKEKQKELERERQRQLEREKRRELERMQEKERQRERERQKQREEERQQELDKERRLLEIQKEKHKMEEMERIKEQERKQLEEFQKQRQKEKERQELIELEKQRLREKKEREEAEKIKQMALEQEMLRIREIEKERERQKEMEREHQKEIEREKQRQEQERQQLIELKKQKQKERERQQLLELEKQRLQEKKEREEAERIKQLALEQEMLRIRELDKEKERQKEMERERQKVIEREVELQRQRDLERQRQLDSERQEIENQRLRREQDKEKQRIKELERLKEMEKRQLLEFEIQKQAERERQQIFEAEKRRLREKMEKDEADKMRQIAKQQEAERQRLKDKQRKDEQDRLKQESSPLRPKVLDLDSVLRTDPLSKATSQRSDPANRWKEPYKPGILDIDSFTSQAQHSPSKDLFSMGGIQGLDSDFGARLHPTPERDINWKTTPQTSGGFASPVWTAAPQDPWEIRPVEMPVAQPRTETPKNTNRLSLDQFVLKQDELLSNPVKNWPAQDDLLHFASRTEAKPANTPSALSSSSPMEQIWLPREPHPQESRGHIPSQRRSQGSQELNRMRSRSVSRRSAPPGSSLEGNLSRVRSRSAQREQDRQSWVPQKQSGEEEEKEEETPVRDTDSQYGTWETGLRTDDSLTPATPSSESNLSPSPRKPTPLHTPGDPPSQSEADTPDSVPPSSSSESQLAFPDAPINLLDTSALRSRAQLGKKRAPRTRPTRATRQAATPAEEGNSEDWLYRDSTEAKPESKEEDSDSEEQAKGTEASPAVASQPQRVALFPGVDPSALKAQLKKRSDSDIQVNGPASSPSPSQLSRSPRSPFLPRAARVLPPAGGKENGEEDSPQWLKELKSKKRLSQYENDS